MGNYPQIETHAQLSQKMLDPIGILQFELPQAPSNKLDPAQQVLNSNQLYSTENILLEPHTDGDGEVS